MNEDAFPSSDLKDFPLNNNLLNLCFIYKFDYLPSGLNRISRHTIQDDSMFNNFMAKFQTQKTTMHLIVNPTFFHAY